MMNNKKIYCKDCMFLERNGLGGNLYNCSYPDNTKMIKINYWYWQEYRNKYKRTPQKINKHNNCKWFRLNIMK